MNIEIRTGFEKIKHTINFQPQTMAKGQKLSEAHHCRQVVEHRCNRQSYLIEGKIIRQASVSQTPYSVKLWVNVRYYVNCKCKHIASLIYYINTDQSKTKTSSEQVWGKPSDKKFVQEKYSKGRFFDQMYPPPPPSVQNVVSIPPRLEELTKGSALRQMLLAEIIKDESENSIPKLMSEILDKVENILENEAKVKEKQQFVEGVEACVETFFFLEEYKVYEQFDFNSLNNDLKDYYQNTILNTDIEILKLCCDTVEQSLNNMWRKERSLRISASSKVHKIKIRNKKTIESLVNEFIEDKSIKNKSLDYGLKNEIKAKVLYEKLHNCKVFSVGVIIIQQGSFTYTVFRDENFIENVILQSEEFYFKYYLPALHAKDLKQVCDHSVESLKRTFTGKNIANM
ncbi:hypothetical protein PV328_001240 [Microctonus aethiopoides]|uniref:Uncharacterized protein n=1 Tax=Microctonus aethiopoides TaxID=144406 RepID=A0AA39KXF1_9HYME|nr:hypothetical protein PV328_001240 [Microctonus aethiopoides]